MATTLSGWCIRGIITMEDKNIEVEETVEEVVEQPEQVTFTQADLDREISKRFEKWQLKAEKQTEEATKLASMNAEEKARYEIEQSRKEIEGMRRDYTIQQNKNECMKILSERNIDVALADFVVAEDAETMKENIDKIDKAFKKSVEEEINRRLKGFTPKKDLQMPNEINKETFNKMNLDQQTEIYNTNRELYDQLIK